MTRPPRLLLAGSFRMLLRSVLLLAFLVPFAARGDDFDRDLRPLFEANCVSCHSSREKAKGGLALDSRDAILKGGSSGPALVPGNSKQSLIAQMVHKDGSPHMPPKGQLSDAEMATIAKWIDALPAETQVGSNEKKSADHWAFRKPLMPAVPTVGNPGWVKDPIDAFVLAKLEAAGLQHAEAAAPVDLIRRVYFDLIGLPPTPEEVDAFLKEHAATPRVAYEKVIDRLLASPHYGERWGRHWLDLTRYADTGGFHNDLDRPAAWRYRDYVIKSFNEDKPYPRFVREQLAGDEISPRDVDALIATGFGRNGPSNDDNMGKNPKDLEKYRLDELDGVISTTFTTFLGLTLGCARCHDHKYDPISQKEYYQVLAVFNGTEKKALPLNGELLADGKLKDPGQGIMALIEISAKVRPTKLLWRGDVGNPGPEVQPGVPVALASNPLKASPPSDKSSGRRTALAEWIASPDNPLSYRVLANRVWQHHFGRGIVATPGNFGRRGAEPSHPELLDYLAIELANNGGRLKPLHKKILFSAAYQQSTKHDPKAAEIDPENALVWRQNKQRLEAEAVRDAILAAAGTLNPKAGGPGIKPRLRPELLPASQRNKWPLIKDETAEHWRRSVYIYQKRQLLFPLLELFDAPTTTDVCDRRTVSVVPTQALLLMNDEFVNDQAKKLAERVMKEAGTPSAQAERAFRLVLSRTPSPERISDAIAFLQQQAESHRSAGKNNPDAEALTDLCHVLFNCNEFIFVD